MKRPEPVTKEYAEKAAALALGAADAIAEYVACGMRLPRLPALLLDEARLRLTEAANALGDLLTDDAPATAVNSAPSHAPAVPKAEHRHKFDDAGRCTVCGKQKSANGRKPAAATAPTAEERTLTMGVVLPVAPLGDVAADKFAGGGLGSSGVRR